MDRLMKKIMFLLALVVVALMSTSCSSQFYCKFCPTTTTTIHTIEVKDTTIIKEIIRDTTITVILPADTVITVLVVECDSLGFAQMKEHVIKSKNMVARLKIENGKLTQNITHLLDSLDVTIQIRDREITNLKSHIENLDKKEIKQVPHIPKWVKILAWIGAVLSLLILITLIYNIAKRIQRFFGY